MTDHTARPESWKAMTLWAASRGLSADCIELRARVERLEQAQQQPAPSTPAGQGELVSSVTRAIPDGDSEMDWTPEARAAILAVAYWLAKQGWGIDATMLRREVGR